MGCGPSKTRNIQSDRTRAVKAMTPQQEEQQMETANTVHQLFINLTDQNTNDEKKSSVLNEQFSENGNKKAQKICSYLRTLLSASQDNIKSEEVGEAVLVSSFLVRLTSYDKPFHQLTKDELNAMGVLMKKENNQQILDAFVRFFTTLFMEKGVSQFVHSDKTFEAAVAKLSQVSTDEIRQQTVEALVEMMLENKTLLKLANNPYYFLEFWLYMVNGETQLDRQLYWLETIGQLYSSGKVAEECLFHESDFRVLVDVLVRVLYSCPDGKTLKVPLECYLVLSCTEHMKSGLYRINDIKEYLSQIDTASLGIQDLAQEIMQLN